MQLIVLFWYVDLYKLVHRFHCQQLQSIQRFPMDPLQKQEKKRFVWHEQKQKRKFTLSWLRSISIWLLFIEISCLKMFSYVRVNQCPILVLLLIRSIRDLFFMISHWDYQSMNSIWTYRCLCFTSIIINNNQRQDNDIQILVDNAILL